MQTLSDRLTKQIHDMYNVLKLTEDKSVISKSVSQMIAIASTLHIRETDNEVYNLLIICDAYRALTKSDVKKIVNSSVQDTIENVFINQQKNQYPVYIRILTYITAIVGVIIMLMFAWYAGRTTGRAEGQAEAAYTITEPTTEPTQPIQQ